MECDPVETEGPNGDVEMEAIFNMNVDVEQDAFFRTDLSTDAWEAEQFPDVSRFNLEC